MLVNWLLSHHSLDNAEKHLKVIKCKQLGVSSCCEAVAKGGIGNPWA